MAKFNYIKWVTENKHGKSINEQTGSMTGSFNTGSMTGSFNTGSMTGSSNTGSSNTGSVASAPSAPSSTGEFANIILKTLSKEGGAAGLEALEKAVKKAGMSPKNLERKIRRIKGVKQHKDGDYIATDGLRESLINEREVVGQHRGRHKYDCQCHVTNDDGQTMIVNVYCSEKYCQACCDEQFKVGKAMEPTGMDMDMMDVNPMTGTGPTNPMDMEMDRPMRLKEVKNTIKKILTEQKFYTDDFYIPVPSMAAVGLNTFAYVQQNPGIGIQLQNYGVNGMGGEPLEDHTCCMHVKATQEAYNQVMNDYPNLEVHLSAQECEANWSATVAGYFPDPNASSNLDPYIPYSNPAGCVRGGQIDPNAVVGLDPDKFNFEKKPEYEKPFKGPIDPEGPYLSDKMRGGSDTHTLSIPQGDKDRKPARPRKPMRMREAAEIIKAMLDEKKKKKKDRCHRKADQVYGTKTSAYKSGAIVKCRKGMIWKVGSKKKKKK